jgi:hypothetical protein
MSSPPSFGSPNQEIPPSKSKWRPIVITIVSAVLLGAGSCFGFITTNGLNQILGIVFAGVFFSCVAAFVAGLIWALGAFIEGLRRGGG